MCILSRTDNSLFDVENTSLFTQFVKLFKRSKKDQYRLDYVVKILLDKGGDVNFAWEERGEDGMAMIHRACDVGAFPFVKVDLSRLDLFPQDINKRVIVLPPASL